MRAAFGTRIGSNRANIRGTPARCVVRIRRTPCDNSTATTSAITSAAATQTPLEPVGNISFSYNIEPLNTVLRVGVDNVTDKQPPIIFFENTANANTDVNTYDTVGRFYFGSVTVKF